MAKLYEIEKDSKIMLPITDGVTESNELCIFRHLDGAFSVIETPKGDIVHLSASAELERQKDYWKLKENANGE